LGAKNVFSKTIDEIGVSLTVVGRNLCRTANLAGMNRWLGFKQMQNYQSCSVVIKAWFV
jgi:hypothetical protein